MPRYFFDIAVDNRRTDDQDGCECSDDASAAEVALALLPNVARDEIPDSGRRTFAVEVRDDGGRSVFRGSFVVATEWTLQQPPGLLEQP